MHVRLAGVVLVLCLAAPLAAQTAFITGSVRDDGGQALVDMTVAAYKETGESFQTRTDSLGRYTLTLPVGTYRIAAWDNNGVWAVGYYKGARSFEGSEAINLRAVETFPADFRLIRAVAISGTVVDSTTGGPVTGAVVAAYNTDGSRKTWTTTQSNGTFTLYLPPDTYKLVAYHDFATYVPEFYSEQRLFENAASVFAPTFGINFTLDRGTKVTGTITEKGTSTKVGGLAVVAYDLQGNVRFRTATNALGDFAFVLPPGNYKIAAEDASRKYQTTFYRDATTFAAGSSLAVGTDWVVADFSVGRTPEPPRRTTLYVAAAGSGPGANNTFFKTDVWITNPNATAITVTAAFLRAKSYPSKLELPLTIAPKQQAQYVDIVHDLFGSSDFGALKFESDATFRVTSRTYNVPLAGPEAGTYGLSLPGQTIGGSVGRASLSGLSNNLSSRTNIGLLNPQPAAITVNIEIFSADGTLINSVSQPVEPLQWMQVSAIPFGTESAYAVVSSTDGSFFAYASVVDQKSGDGTIIMPVAD